MLRAGENIHISVIHKERQVEHSNYPGIYT